MVGWAEARTTGGHVEGGTAESDTTLVVVTGLSGGGRSTVARALENVGYYVVDNLPQALMLDMAELAIKAGGRGPAYRDGAGRASRGPSPPTWPGRSGS